MSLILPAYQEYWRVWSRQLGIARLRLGLVEFAPLVEQEEPEPMAVVAAQYLTEEERQRFAGFARMERRAQWLGGRLAAKWAVAGLAGGEPCDLREIRIGTAQGGRPLVTAWRGKGAETVPPSISISHSGRWAAALAADLPCGLDLQRCDPKIIAVCRRFVGPEEEELLTALPGGLARLARLSLLWAAKEAVRKMGWPGALPGFLQIRLLEVGAGAGSPESPFVLRLAVQADGLEGPASVGMLAFIDDEMAWALGCRGSISKGKGDPWNW